MTLEIQDSAVASEDQELSMQELTGTLSEHWKKGIPTFLLISSAILLFAFFRWSVKPGLEDRYQAIVLQNAHLLEPSTNAGERSSQFEDNPEGLSERIKQLKVSQLCLRRLIAKNQLDSSYRWQYGLVSSALSEAYLREAKLGNQIDRSSDAVKAFMSMSKSEEQNAVDAMERTRRMEGEKRSAAVLWLAGRQLQGVSAVPYEQLIALERMTRELADPSSKEVEANRLLADILISQSLAVDSDVRRSERTAKIKEALTLVAAHSESSLPELAKLAKAHVSFDPERAREIAALGARRIWEQKSQNELSMVEQAAAFDCLILSSSIKEGQAYLSESLSTAAEMDASELRQRTSRSCLQLLIANSLRIAEQSTGNVDPTWTDAMLGMAVQLAPDSFDVLKFLDSVASQRESNSIWPFVRDKITQGGDPSAQQLVAIVDAIFSTEEWNPDRLKDPTSKVPWMLMCASRFVVRLESEKRLQPGRAIEVLRTINQVSPELLIAWSDRASLHLKNKEFAEAVECLEWLHEKAPSNEQIKEALDSAKSNIAATRN